MNKRVDYHNPITHQLNWRGYKLTDSQAHEGFYANILEETIVGLEELFSHHKRINIIIFDLYFNNEDDQYVDLDTNKNELVSRFFKILKRRLQRWKKENKETKSSKNREIKRIVYQAVREKSSQRRGHYHCYIAIPSQVQNENEGRQYVNESTKEYIWIYKIIADAWRAVIYWGSVNFGTSGYNSHFYWLDYNSATFEDDFSNCFRDLSYLAKVATKNQGQHSKEYFASSSITRRDAGVRLESTSINRKSWSWISKQRIIT